MKATSSFPGFVFIMIAGLGSVAAYVVDRTHSGFAASITFLVSIILATLVFASVWVADPWTRGVVLRLGSFAASKVPVCSHRSDTGVDPYGIDTRTRNSAFKAEKTLTKDTIPVKVDAILFWKVVDPKRAALEVTDFYSAISSAAQTALRETIGKTGMADLVAARDRISEVLRQIIGQRAEPWGIEVISVEIKDLQIRPALQEVLSMHAEPDAESQAATTLGELRSWPPSRPQRKSPSHEAAL